MVSDFLRRFPRAADKLCLVLTPFRSVNSLAKPRNPKLELILARFAEAILNESHTPYSAFANLIEVINIHVVYSYIAPVSASPPARPLCILLLFYCSISVVSL